jgi:hypothetical protein
MAKVLDEARAATADLPNGSTWVPPPAESYTLGLSNFPVAYGCRDPNVTGFDVIGFYGDWGSSGLLRDMRTRQKHREATAEKFEDWLAQAGFENRNRVWHTNVLLALRNGEYSAADKSESKLHAMYRNFDLMKQSAAINRQVERDAHPSLNVTFDIRGIVASLGLRLTP